MQIKLICVGDINHKYLREGINDYTQRIGNFLDLQIIEVYEGKSSDINKNKKKEAEAIYSHIHNDDYVITLEIEGKNLDSESLAAFMEQHFTYSPKTLVFVIGGSDGLGEEVQKRSNFKLSFGKMTFPHQLMRLVLLEQIYRGLMIINHRKYHK